MTTTERNKNRPAFNLGPTMKAGLKVLASEFGGVAPSRNKLAQVISSKHPTYHGYPVVTRMIKAGLVELDPTSDAATPQSAGAVVLTEKGCIILALLNSKKGADDNDTV